MKLEIRTTLNEADEAQKLIERARELTAPADAETLDAGRALLRLRQKAREVEANG